jgi:hypothetical protein
LGIKSGVGNLTIGGSTGDLLAETGVGDIYLENLACSGEKLKAHSGTGGVHAGLRSIPKKSVEADTGVGDISLSIAGDSRADLHAITGVGDITSAFAQPEPRGIGQVGGSLSGSINGGGTRVELSTGTGNVHLDKTR